MFDNAIIQRANRIHEAKAYARREAKARYAEHPLWQTGWSVQTLEGAILEHLIAVNPKLAADFAAADAMRSGA